MKGKKLLYPQKSSPREDKIDYIQDTLRQAGFDVSPEEIGEMLVKHYSVFESFPMEILQEIALTLEYPDIVHLCKASPIFNANICQDDKFWKLLYRRDLSAHPRGKGFDYKKAYQESIVYKYKRPTEVIEHAIKYSNEIQLHRHEKFIRDTYRRNREHFLTLAIKSSEIYIIKYLLTLTRPEDIDIHDPITNWQLLSWAVHNPKFEVFNYIFSILPEIEDLQIVLLTAVSRNRIDIVIFLIKKINSSSSPLDYDKMIELFNEVNSVEMAQYLIKNSNVDFSYSDALIHTGDLLTRKLLEFYLNQGADVNYAPDGIESSALYQAVISPNLQKVKLLYKYGANPGDELGVLLESSIENLSENPGRLETLLFLIDNYHPSEEELMEVGESIHFFEPVPVHELVKRGIPVTLRHFTEAVSVDDVQTARTLLKYLKVTDEQLKQIADDVNIDLEELRKELRLSQ